MSQTIQQQRALMAQRAADGEGATRVSIPTLLRGDASAAERKEHTLAVLREAGLTGDYTPEPYPIAAADGTLVEPGTDAYTKRYDAMWTSQRLMVLGVFAEGLSYTEAADRLHLNVDTVKAHTANVYRLLGASTKVEAMMQAVRFGVLPVPEATPTATPRRRRNAAAEADSE